MCTWIHISVPPLVAVFSDLISKTIPNLFLQIEQSGTPLIGMLIKAPRGRRCVLNAERRRARCSRRVPREPCGTQSIKSPYGLQKVHASNKHVNDPNTSYGKNHGQARLHTNSPISHRIGTLRERDHEGERGGHWLGIPAGLRSGNKVNRALAWFHAAAPNLKHPLERRASNGET